MKRMEQLNGWPSVAIIAIVVLGLVAASNLLVKWPPDIRDALNCQDHWQRAEARGDFSALWNKADDLHSRLEQTPPSEVRRREMLRVSDELRELLNRQWEENYRNCRVAEP